ncbi:Biofilm growth-associated repressor [Oceanibacterium hippocampi]|uniref:Biofilm growth-associated repressor n=2 Tax=Oceanibacterium hippocampi TaxID=745714 RepID=A0A1Y5RZ41_9PROT|nr:Biofilm growth-associated repressor [Oceanibacterium hippocampi]
MYETAETVSELMKALSSRNRLLILCQLVQEELSVGELASRLDMREPAMSQQLAVLRRDGLVSRRRDGQVVYYTLARPDIRQLMEFLYETFCAPNE